MVFSRIRIAFRPRIDKQYKVKKAEMEKPKEARNPGRLPKSSTRSVSRQPVDQVGCLYGVREPQKSAAP
ncbi:MAG: hypothetical protein AB7T22_15905 [Calditrichaceae bacterium]